MTIIEEHHTDDRRRELEAMTKRELVEYIELTDRMQREANIDLESAWAGGVQNSGTVVSFDHGSGYGAVIEVELPHALAGDVLSIGPGTRVTIV